VILFFTTVASVPAGEPTRHRLIDARTHWRYFMVWKSEDVRFASGEVHAVRFVGRGRHRKMEKTRASRSALPPEAWRKSDFDDAAWPRRRLPVMSTRGRAHSLLCARTQFRIGDPDKLEDLDLSITYRGGVVVYLNGTELTRAHLPEGKIGPDAPAVDYPKDVYLDPNGHLLRLGWRDPSRYKDRFAARDRHLKGFAVPASKLRPGVNTLALELHRPPTDIILYTGKTEKYRRDQWCPWRTLGLKAVALSAPAGSPGLAAPLKGLHVDNASALLRLFADDGGDPCRELRRVRIHAARNGAFSAQVLVSSAGPMKGLAAAASKLEGPDGSALAADHVEVRYAAPDGPAFQRGGPSTFDGLMPEPPAAVAVPKGACRAGRPLWITVHVPGDAPAGEYRGTARVTAEGMEPVDVPLHVSVADWTLPDPHEFESWVGLVQSPESVALRYKVPLWSERHWELIGRSFEQMGRLGTRIIYVPLFRQSCFGNEHSMVRWIKKPGGWEHDFRVFEQYVDAALERLKTLDVVCIHTWARSSGGAYFGMKKYKRKGQPYRFSVLDPQTGELEAAEGPHWTDPEAAAFFRPVFDGIRERLRKRGVEDAMMVGIGHDVIPSQACVDVLAKASGGAKWVMHCHPRRWSCRNRPVGYLAHVWGSPVATLDRKRRRYGWKESRLYATFPRYGSGTVGKLGDNSPPVQYRVALESALCAGIKGYGWVGADFWRVVEGKHNRRRTPFDRYPGYDQRGNLGIAHAFLHVLNPGPAGPAATVRFEMLREGAQEGEARTFLERALRDPAKKAKLGADLAGRCEALLEARLRDILRARSYWDMLVWEGWDRRKGELYALAAEVAARLD
jgi:hypothetical protein